MLVGSQCCARHVSTGNVEQDVNASPLCHNVVGKFLKAGDVQHVTHNADYVLAVCLQLFYTLVQLFLTDVHCHNFGALLHKTFGNAATQNTTCTGDDCHFTCNTELFVHNLFSFLFRVLSFHFILYHCHHSFHLCQCQHAAME